MKELARIKHLQLRNSLSQKDIQEKSRVIMEKLLSMPEFEHSKTILFYASFGSEVQTQGMIKKALAHGKTITVPVTSFENKTLKISRISSLEDLEQKETGLIEPKVIDEIQIEKIDLIIVPGVAFCREGNRLGYGGGFYDRLLNRAPHGIVSVGLCFEQNTEQCLPNQSHDAKVDFVVTEERIVTTSES